jgi:hypothetical protein
VRASSLNAFNSSGKGPGQHSANFCNFNFFFFLRQGLPVGRKDWMELQILLSLLPEYWDYRLVPLWQANLFIFGGFYFLEQFLICGNILFLN